MRANERSERPSGPFEKRSSLTRNAPLYLDHSVSLRSSVESRDVEAGERCHLAWVSYLNCEREVEAEAAAVKAA